MRSYHADRPEDFRVLVAGEVVEVRHVVETKFCKAQDSKTCMGNLMDMHKSVVNLMTRRADLMDLGCGDLAVFPKRVAAC